MSSLESVRTLLIDYFEAASTCESEMEKLILLLFKKDFIQNVYDAFFDLVVDSTQSPESIMHLLYTFTSNLDGFSTNMCLRALVAFACFEALARRRPKILNGPWETLAWIILKDSSFPNTTIGNKITHFKQTNPETLKFIIEFGSTELCPNPCLRIQLLKCMSSFHCHDLESDYDRDSFRNNVITTLFELCDNYKSLTIDQLPNFTPMDLQYLMKDNNIDIRYIMNNNDLFMKKSKIIADVLKLTRNLALIEKEKHQTLTTLAIRPEIWHVDIEGQLSACLSFCGLIPHDPDDYSERYECMAYLVEAVGNDSLLQNYVIETLDTITQVSLSFPDNEDTQQTTIHEKDKILCKFVRGHIKRLPTLRYLQEINGGLAPAEEYRLRYCQNNIIDQYNDSDTDSECNNIQELVLNFPYNISEDNHLDIDISD